MYSDPLCTYLRGPPSGKRKREDYDEARAHAAACAYLAACEDPARQASALAAAAAALAAPGEPQWRAIAACCAAFELLPGAGARARLCAAVVPLLTPLCVRSSSALPEARRAGLLRLLLRWGAACAHPSLTAATLFLQRQRALQPLPPPAEDAACPHWEGIAGALRDRAVAAASAAASAAAAAARRAPRSSSKGSGVGSSSSSSGGGGGGGGAGRPAAAAEGPSLLPVASAAEMAALRAAVALQAQLAECTASGGLLSALATHLETSRRLMGLLERRLEGGEAGGEGAALQEGAGQAAPEGAGAAGAGGGSGGQGAAELESDEFQWGSDSEGSQGGAAAAAAAAAAESDWEDIGGAQGARVAEDTDQEPWAQAHGAIVELRAGSGGGGGSCGAGGSDLHSALCELVTEAHRCFKPKLLQLLQRLETPAPPSAPRAQSLQGYLRGRYEERLALAVEGVDALLRRGALVGVLPSEPAHARMAREGAQRAAAAAAAAQEAAQEEARRLARPAPRTLAQALQELRSEQ